MDWSKVNAFAFFPPAFAIYLSATAGSAKGYLHSQVNRAAARGAVQGQETFVRNLAAGWAAQLGFVNAMLAAMFSAFSIWSASGSYTGVVLTVALLLVVFTPMVFYLLAYEPDQVEAVTGRFGTPARVCKVVLLSVNVVLIIAIAANQQLTPKPPPPAGPAPAAPPG